MVIQNYTQEELNFIINNYKNKTNKELAQELGKTIKAINIKLCRLKLKRDEKYTKENLDFMIKNYKNMSNKEIGKILGKNPDCIGNKLNNMGLKKTPQEIKNNYERNRTTKKYTEEEINFIINNYRSMSNDDIGAKLGLTRDAIRKKLKRLGLKKTLKEIKINYQNNKQKCGFKGIFHPLYGQHRSEDVKNKIIKKLKYRTTPYIKKTIRVNGRSIPKSHYVWCSQPENLSHVPKGCVIHHYDNNSENNSPDNLVLLPENDHHKIHCQISKMIRSEL
jgi:DNA-binding Lrp family transcriptional regulator